MSPTLGPEFQLPLGCNAMPVSGVPQSLLDPDIEQCVKALLCGKRIGQHRSYIVY